MVLNIRISPETETRLRQQAEAAGKDVTTYVTQLVETAAAQHSLDELLAPLRHEFAASGTSDDQLVQQITAAQQDYRAERQNKRSA